MMPYADAATQEALRLAAVVPISSKVALKTFELGGYTIPKVCVNFKDVSDPANNATKAWLLQQLQRSPPR